MEEKKRESVRVEENHFITAETRWTNIAERRRNLSPGGFLFFSRRQQLETQISHPLTASDKRRDETRRRISRMADQSERLRSRKKRLKEKRGKRRRGKIVRGGAGGEGAVGGGGVEELGG